MVLSWKAHIYFSWTSLWICLISRLLRTAIHTKPQQSNKYWFCISPFICIFLTLIYFPLYLIHLEDFINFVPGWLDLIWNLGNPTARRSDTYCQWKAILKSLLKLKNFNFVQKILSRKLQTFQKYIDLRNLQLCDIISDQNFARIDKFLWLGLCDINLFLDGIHMWWV